MIRVESDSIQVVNDRDIIENVKPHQITKLLPTDRRRTVRDTMGNTIQLEDSVFVSNRQSNRYRQQGVIKNICRNCLFLWDRAFMDRSNGVFTEKWNNVTIKGYELLRNESSRHMPALANQNRIQKHWMLNQVVLVICGELKGQRGRVTHVNGDMASLEMSVRAKKVNIPLDNLRLPKDDDRRSDNRGTAPIRRPQYSGMQGQ